MDSKKGIETQFFISLKMLAMVPEQQIDKNGPGCITCDLYNDFEHYYRSYLAEFGASLDNVFREKLEKLFKFLEHMPEEDFVCFDNTMISRVNWNTVRDLSREILSLHKSSYEDILGYIEVSPGVWERH